RQHPQRLLEELLTGFVPLEDDDRFDLHGRGEYPPHDTEGGLAPRGNSWALPVLRRARESHRRRGETRADRVARDSARVARRVDLAPREREAAGDGRRQGGARAVPVPPDLPRAAGGGEVREAY